MSPDVPRTPSLASDRLLQACEKLEKKSLHGTNYLKYKNLKLNKAGTE